MDHMKKILLSFVLVTVGLAADGRAQESTTPIYVVDMQRVLDETVIGKAAKVSVDQAVKKGKTELEKSRLEIESLKKAIEKQGALLSDSAKKQKAEQIVQKERDLMKKLEDQRELVVKKNVAEIDKIIAAANEVVQEIAGKNKYEFVLERDNRLVVYVDKKYDLTDKVIKTLDDRKLAL